MKKYSRAIVSAILALALSCVGLSPTFAAVGLVVSAGSIITPDPNQQFDCSQSALEAVRTDGGMFSNSDYFELTYRFPELDSPEVKRRSFALQSPGISREKYLVSGDYSSRARISGGTLIYELCTYLMPNSRLSKIELIVTHRNLNSGLIDLETSRVTVDILPREEKFLTLENLQDSCQMNTSSPYFRSNLLISQISKPMKSGGKVAISGTFFSRGVAAANVRIQFREENPSTTLKLGKFLGSATTDAKGQFRFSFKLKKYKGHSITEVEAYVPDRLNMLGPIGLISENFSAPLLFDWYAGGKYKNNIYDWIPSPAGQCKVAYSTYETYTASHSDDDDHPVWMYAAKRVFYAIKNKKSRSVTDIGSSRGSCYVSGYFRNGTWVNGYFRNC